MQLFQACTHSGNKLQQDILVFGLALDGSDSPEPSDV
jgi:hypothetical protein